MKAFGFVFTLIIAAFVCACAKTTITPLLDEASVVQFAPNAPSNCIRLGEIQGYKRNTQGNLSLLELRNSAKNELKNKAYAMGADTLVIIGTDSISATDGFYATRSFYPYETGFYVPASYPKEYLMDAIAYKCKN